MTVKEITELRKSGRIKEAQEAAEREFAGNKNKYTAGALFWCLHDRCTKQAGEDVERTYNEMKELCEEYAPDDTFMTGALRRVERLFAPHYAELKQALAAAKRSENVVAACRALSECYDRKELGEGLYNDYGWLLYYALKQTDVKDVASRKRLLSRYLGLNLERPSILHSLILAEGIKMEQNTPLQFRIRDFVGMWGLENLREEDWLQYKTEAGNTLPSLVEKLIGVYAKELKTDHARPSEDFCELLDKAVVRFANNQNMPYFKANVLIAQGRSEDAIGYYKEMILRFPSKFYLWSQLAALTEDADIRLGLLCKAVNTGEDEGYIGGVRLRLAALLAERGLYAHAQHELDLYRCTYERQGWQLRPEFRELANGIPLGTVGVDNGEVYARYFVFADRFIYSELPGIYVVKVDGRKMEDLRHPGRQFVEWRLRGESKTYFLRKPRRYGLGEAVPNGAVLEAKVLKGRIVWIKHMEHAPGLGWLRKETGKVKLLVDRKGHSYAFINGVYVGEKLLRGLVEGKVASVVALRQDDGRWQAVRVLKNGK